MSEVLINDDIPRTMTRQGLEYLGRIARTVPQHGVILEIGPLFGSSTWVLAKNAHPSVRVITVDTWTPVQWLDRLQAKWPGCKPFSKDAFHHYTRDCANVTAVQGVSPQVMESWSEPLDLFFDDATQRNRGFGKSLEFYLPKLKPGAIAAGDDFTAGAPDIVNAVSRLAEHWHTRPEIVGRVWAMVKPGEDRAEQSVYAKAGPYSDYDLVTSVRQRSGDVVRCFPGSWSGHLHQSKSISALRMDWAIPRDDGLSGVYQVAGGRNRVSPWVPFGEWAQVDGAVTSLRGHLVGQAGAGLQLAYQACCIVPSPKSGQRVNTVNTKVVREGAWTQSTNLIEDFNTVGISAVRCFVEQRGARSVVE